MINVLIADDHPRIREAFGFLLQTAGDMEIVAMAANGEEAFAQAVLYCPNIAILDVSMPVMDGLEATRQICSSCPQTRVLIVSMHDTHNYIVGCLLAGASGYILKDVAGDELVIAVRSLYDGNTYFSERIAEIAKYYL